VGHPRLACPLIQALANEVHGAVREKDPGRQGPPRS
jgi:hypothetical protein